MRLRQFSTCFGEQRHSRFGHRNIRKRIVALPFCNPQLKIKKPPHKSYPQSVLTTGDAIRQRRMDLGLRPKDVALIIGCDTDTITNWEKGRRSPTISHTARIAKFWDTNPSVSNLDETCFTDIPEVRATTFTGWR